MKLAIMQPYFMPYVGYFQLINAVDKFIVYDNIQFTKKGWINRNRILANGKDSYVTLPIKKDSDYLDVVNRELADTWPKDRVKMLNRISGAYRKAPQFGSVFPLIEEVLLHEETNLFSFILNSLRKVTEFLGIETPLIVSSSLPVDHSLKAEDKVLALCHAVGASEYINPIGGVDLYSKERFQEKGIELQFLKSKFPSYSQFSVEFVPWLSIMDVMMFVSRESLSDGLTAEYDLIK